MRSPGGTPYDGLYREALPESSTFFRLQVYERVGKSVIWVSEKAQKGLTDEFYVSIKSRKCSIFAIGSCLNERAFAAVKRDADRVLNKVYEMGTICQ